MQFREKWTFLLLLLLNYAIIAENTKATAEELSTEKVSAQQGKSGENPLLTAKIYAKLFEERRQDHKAVIKQLLVSNYENNFKLLDLAYVKIFEVIKEKNLTLTSTAYQPAEDGFPETAELQDAVTLTLESCCVAAESVLHFPEISYRIFRNPSFSHWKLTLNWCIDFVNALPHVTDESTVKLMELLQMEINEELRTTNYVNPYYKKPPNSEPKKPTKKPPKKLKKGPQLRGSRIEL